MEGEVESAPAGVVGSGTKRWPGRGWLPSGVRCHCGVWGEGSYLVVLVSFSSRWRGCAASSSLATPNWGVSLSELCTKYQVGTWCKKHSTVILRSFSFVCTCMCACNFSITECDVLSCEKLIPLMSGAGRTVLICLQQPSECGSG